MSIMKRITAKFFVLYVSPFLCFNIAFTHKNRKQLKEDDFESNEEEIQIAWPRETNEQYSHTSKFLDPYIRWACVFVFLKNKTNKKIKLQMTI